MIKVVITTILLIALIACVAFFSGSETAFLTLTQVRLKGLFQQAKTLGRNQKIPDNKSDNKIKKLMRTAALKSRMDSLLSLILIGTNFCSSLSAALMTALLVTALGEGASALSTIIVSFFITTFGQIVPKTIAIRKPDETALNNSFVLNVLLKVLAPLVVILAFISRLATKATDLIFGASGPSPVTEEDLKALIAISTKEGSLAPPQAKVLNKVFRFSDLKCSDAMTHRVFVHSISTAADYKSAKEAFSQTGKKFLICTKENCTPANPDPVGILYYKDVLFCSNKNDETGFIERNMQSALFIPETLPLLECLAHLRNENKKIAVALDEQGSFSGIITVDDIIKVIFTAVQQEEGDNPLQNIRVVSGNEFLVTGTLTLTDLNDILRIELVSDEVNTLGGFVLNTLGHLPKKGDTFSYPLDKSGDTKIPLINFTVEEVECRRVSLVRIKINNI